MAEKINWIKLFSTFLQDLAGTAAWNIIETGQITV